jgi:hypothetical protein
VLTENTILKFHVRRLSNVQVPENPGPGMVAITLFLLLVTFIGSQDLQSVPTNRNGICLSQPNELLQKNGNSPLKLRPPKLIGEFGYRKYNFLKFHEWIEKWVMK